VPALEVATPAPQRGDHRRAAPLIKHANAAADRPYPLLWDGHDYAALPLTSLTLDSGMTRLIAPYCVTLAFFSTTRGLLVGRGDPGDSLTGRSIRPGDALLFDHSRTTPRDDAIVLVEDGREFVARVCHVLADGAVEFHATAADYPILTGERRIWYCHVKFLLNEISPRRASFGHRSCP